MSMKCLRVKMLLSILVLGGTLLSAGSASADDILIVVGTAACTYYTKEDCALAQCNPNANQYGQYVFNTKHIFSLPIEVGTSEDYKLYQTNLSKGGQARTDLLRNIFDYDTYLTRELNSLNSTVNPSLVITPPTSQLVNTDVYLRKFYNSLGIWYCFYQ